MAATCPQRLREVRPPDLGTTMDDAGCEGTTCTEDEIVGEEYVAAKEVVEGYLPPPVIAGISPPLLRTHHWRDLRTPPLQR
jgi:hypothetical protein